ncbi:MAG: membrane protein insertase YidC [Phycisphaerales bacterium]
MAEGRNRVVGILVPAVLALGLVALGVGLFKPKAPANTAQPGEKPAAAQAGANAGAPSAGSATKPAYTGPLVAPLKPAVDWNPIGGLDTATPASPLMQVKFYPMGAGINELSLSRHHMGADPKSPNEVLQQTHVHNGNPLVPFALAGVKINDEYVSLSAGGVDTATGAAVETCWTQAAPGRFVADINDATGRAVARVTREFRLVEGVYEFTLDTKFENLTDTPMTVQFTEVGPAELPISVIRYGGDPRRVRMGLITDPDVEHVAGRSPVISRNEFLGHLEPTLPVWPPAKPPADKQWLSWVGTSNRFFAVTVHARPSTQPTWTERPQSASGGDKRLNAYATVDRVVLLRGPDKDGKLETNAVAALCAFSPSIVVAGGQAHSASVGVYAGPVDHETLGVVDRQDGKIGLTDLEIYYWPGPCSFCAFQPIAYFLRWVLSIFADYVVFDWALAIILLVVCVRTSLHPITKWSQTSLQRFGKQMQRVGPKQKALQEKFKDDPARLRQEIAAMMKEENVNYAGALGCLPMLMQTPIWIALSAMMFFLFDLRHTPAFFGIIQKLTGGHWQFLADMAEPDRFIKLPFTFTVPLMNQIDSVNILPVILGLVFFIQQKYLTPPPTAQLSPEMEMQQKIMKVVIVFMFPIMMYNAPSGLALYFITNSTLGIIESRHIRKAFEKQEAEREELRKRNPHAFDKQQKPGFFARFQARIAEAQARAEQIKSQQNKYGPRK